MLKKLTAGLVVALATTVAHTASAMVIEAVWDVQFEDVQFDYISRQDVPLDMPKTAQITTRFSTDARTARDYGYFTHTTFAFDQPVVVGPGLHDGMVPNPLPGGPRYHSNMLASSYNYTGSYSEKLTITDQTTYSDINNSWSYSYDFSIDYFGDFGSDAGREDIEFTDAYLFDFLTDLMNNPNQFSAWFYLSNFHTGWYHTSPVPIDYIGYMRRGKLRLTSLSQTGMAEPPVDVPEPPAAALIGAGLLSVALLRRRRQAEKAAN